ncbi:MAG: (2Fe-2S)-binding protein [Pseudomonadota bacterium]
MYVCLCNAVTESDIADAVNDGVTSVAELRNTLGLATGCGGCVGVAQDVLNKATSGALAARQHGASETSAIVRRYVPSPA